MVIDAHHHFWRYNPKEYDWIDDAMAVLRRDFLPLDLHQEIRAAAVDRVVSVQARQSLEETHWLLDLASRHEWIAGVVGWVPLTSSEIHTILQSLLASPHGKKLRAVRHVVQGESDPQFLARPEFNAGISTLKSANLIYDILIFERQLPVAIGFVDRHPHQIFVLDHVAKPKIREGVTEPWATQMRELAKRRNVYCKISGMVTEANWQKWSLPTLRPYLDVALDAFGPDRLMFGTDWPVCRVACEYGRWKQLVEEWARPLSAAEQRQIMGETAIRAYQL